MKTGHKTTRQTIQFHRGNPELPKEEIEDDNIVNNENENGNFVAEKNIDDKDHEVTEEKENSSPKKNVDNERLVEEGDDYGIPEPERTLDDETPINKANEKNIQGENPEKEKRNPEKILEVEDLDDENENPDSEENIDEDSEEEDDDENPVEEPSEAAEPIEWKIRRPSFEKIEEPTAGIRIRTF
jgi:hypothetical protein